MGKSVLVVGDAIIDEYIFVRTRRNAAEAPIPVWDEIRREDRPGGAWNVARNIKAMDPSLQVDLAACMTPYSWGMEDPKFCYGTALTKTRYVDENNRIIFRHDDHLKVNPAEAEIMLEGLYEKLAHTVYDAVVYSDYDKGTLLDSTISFCNDLAELVIIDSKRKNLHPFARGRGDWRTILKLNYGEWGMHAADDWPVEAMFDHVVVTKGKEGAMLRQYDLSESSLNKNVVHTEEFPTKRVWAADVTGCGDTHTAAMAVSILRDGGIRNAVRFANEKASQAVQVFGTAVIS